MLYLFMLFFTVYAFASKNLIYYWLDIKFQNKLTSSHSLEVEECKTNRINYQIF